MGFSTFPAVASSALQQYEEVITSSKIWTKPAGVKTCDLTVLGAGASAITGVNGSGGAGAYYRGIVDISANDTYNVTIGAGVGYGSLKGGSTSFGNIVIAEGGGAWTGTANSNSSGNTLFPSSTAAKNLTSKVTYTDVTFYGTGGYKVTASRVAYGNGIYVYVPGMRETASYYTSQYLTSTDGFQSKTTRNLPESQYMWTVFFTGTHFWLFNQTGFYKSTDGISWGTKNTYVGFTYSSGTNSGIVYANGWFVHTNGSTTVRRSQDGINWSTVTAPIAVYWAKVANNIIFGMNSGSNTTNVQYSLDYGLTWSTMSTYYYASDVVYFNGYYHISHWWSTSNVAIYSLVGNTFTQVTSYANGDYGGPIGVDTSTSTMYRQAVGNLFSSTDGFNWSLVSTGMPNSSTGISGTDLYGINGYIIATSAQSAYQDLTSIKLWVGLYGFPGDDNEGGGSVDSPKRVYSYQNFISRQGTTGIQNDPRLINAGMGGVYPSTTGLYPPAFNKMTRYGCGGSATTDLAVSAVGGNGIVIIRWWA